jgi:hypothetical protein
VPIISVNSRTREQEQVSKLKSFAYKMATSEYLDKVF